MWGRNSIIKFPRILNATIQKGEKAKRVPGS